MKLSVIVCVYNEINTIEEILKKIDNVDLPSDFEKEIIIIDNNSTDGTREFLNKLKIANKYKVIFQKKNYGKGNSIITGINEATGNLTVFQDADLEYEPNNYSKLIEYLEKNNLDAVFGSRIMHDEDYFYYKLNRFAVINLTKIINFLFKGSFTDVATNHKLIKTNVLKQLNLKSKGFNLDFEISLKLLKYGFNCGEIPVKYFPRTYKDGKKINFLDAIKSLFIIFYFYFKSR
tara:strand:+ start:1241 stop:1939 length:699 start_codon:yes stop_codon:yes gene_type:complete